MDAICTNAHPPRKKVLQEDGSLKRKTKDKMGRAWEESPLKMVLSQMPGASRKRKSRFWTMAIIINGFKLFVLAIDPPRDLYYLSALKHKNQMRSL